MLKNKKTIFTAVITALFVLSVSYFALLSPTTAWFYQQDTTQYNYSFSFRNFSESVGDTISDQTVQLRAATRFADAGEWLFDEVAHVITVQTSNTGTAGSALTGIVHVDVTNLKLNGSAVTDGIRWFAFAAPTNLAISAPSNGSKGSYKTAAETMLADLGVTVPDYKNIGETQYTTYNTGIALPALNADHARGFVVAPGESKNIYVVFWAEYGDLKSSIERNTVWNGGTYTADIDVTATPYVAAYSTESYTLSVSDWSKVTVVADGLTLTVPSSGSGGLNVPNDAQLRVVAANGYKFASSSVFGCGTQTGTNGSVCSIATMTSNVSLNVQSIS